MIEHTFAMPQHGQKRIRPILKTIPRRNPLTPRVSREQPRSLRRNPTRGCVLRPQPAAKHRPPTLGTLDRIIQTPCLLEPFRKQPTPNEIRSCLLKLFQVHGDYHRQARREEDPLSETQLPYLWILASSASTNLLEHFGASTHADWGEGVYFLHPGLRSVIISINRLPVNPDTLWLRLLGRGKTQQQAINEVIAFDDRDPRRSSILKLLANWKISIEITGQVSEEQELMMALSQAYLEWEQQTEQRGLEKGLQQGAAQGEQSLILRQLTRRIGELSPAMLQQIQSLSLVQLESLGEALLDFTRADDLVTWMQRNS
jgi:Domain of unknown function (DUF4351)